MEVINNRMCLEILMAVKMSKLLYLMDFYVETNILWEHTFSIFMVRPEYLNTTFPETLST